MSQSPNPTRISTTRHGTVAARLAEAANDSVPRSVYDKLTDLFLDPSATLPMPGRALESHATAPAGPLPSGRDPGHDVRVEGVVLGNLPALASAWVTQYAREIAVERNSAIAMLRARSGLYTLEVVGARRTEEGGQTSLVEPSQLVSLDAAILAALQASTWIVCADSEALFADYLEEGLLDGITLLTGADEPAIVACYRNLKSLVVGPSSMASGATLDASVVRIAVMGATHERASDAAHRLEKAAETFLGRKPGRTVCISNLGRSDRSRPGDEDGPGISRTLRLPAPRARCRGSRSSFAGNDAPRIFRFTPRRLVA